MRNLHSLTYALIILGALNWGLIGFFGFDLVATIFGDMTVPSRIVYALVGLAGVIEVVLAAQGYRLTKEYTH